jgi:3-deoxy-D-manno-octulosonic-acid transferase
LATEQVFFKLIIVPHHVDVPSIQKCLNHFNNATTLTSFIQSNQKFNNSKVIIVDQIGLLRSLYQYAYVSYIGGGFDTEGIHNVLEPAAFGKPVLWGPNDEKYREAIGLIDFGGGFKIHDENSFTRILNILIEQEDKYNKASAASANFIQQNSGATQKTMQFIQEKRLLTN